MEYSRALLSFYRYSEAEQAMARAGEALGISLKLTGKMGRISKYATKSAPHLVLDVVSQEVVVKPPEDGPVLEEGEPEEEEKTGGSYAPKNIELGEDSILLERTKLDEEMDGKKLEILDVGTQILVLGAVTLRTRGEAGSEARREEIQAHLERALERDGSTGDWLVFSAALLERSRNELGSTKRRERALLQMQTLMEQWSDKEPSTCARADSFFVTGYPFRWEMAKELAQDYMRSGVFLSAFELLKELKLWEDAVECLFLGGRKTQARTLAAERMKEAPSPALLCVLGDIEQKDEHYRHAWKMSGGRFARAMRALGSSLF